MQECCDSYVLSASNAQCRRMSEKMVDLLPGQELVYKSVNAFSYEAETQAGNSDFDSTGPGNINVGDVSGALPSKLRVKPGALLHIFVNLSPR